MGIGFNPANGEQTNGLVGNALITPQGGRARQQFAGKVDEAGQEALGTTAYVVRNTMLLGNSSNPAAYVRQSGGGRGQAAPTDGQPPSQVQLPAEQDTVTLSAGKVQQSGAAPVGPAAPKGGVY